MYHFMAPAEPDNHTPIKTFWLLLLLITTLAGSMRLYNLSEYSFWEDELYSVRSASAPQGNWQVSKQFGYFPTTLGLLADGAQISEISWDNVDQWQSLGVRPFGARIGSCIVGILSIPLLALAGRRLFGDRTTLILALLLTVSPWHLFWSQAARFYTLQFLFYNLALIWYFRTTQERPRRLAVLAGLAILFAYLSQPPALLISLVLAADVLFCLIRRAPIKLSPFGWAAGIAAVTLCTALQIYDMKFSGSNWDAWGKLQGHTWKIIAASMVLRNGLVITTLAALSTIALLRSKTRLTLYLAAAATLPVLALMALTFKDGMYIHERYAFIVHYAWLALAALGLAALWDAAIKQSLGTTLAATATAAIVASMLWTDLAYYNHGNRRRWNEAFAYVAEHKKPGQAVATLSSKTTPIARYYLQTNDLIPFHQFPTSPQKLDALDQPTWLVLPAVSATHGEMFPWLNELADLKAYYDLRILQPFSSIRVYYHTPSTAPTTEN
jgi:predicted membrane-bound mannosyltransferase